ncbi:MAG: GDSL-type esterase/lipase family protein [Acidimicrobiia bacterium]
MRRRAGFTTAVVALALVGAACSSGSSDRASSPEVVTPRQSATASGPPQSIVQLGDSIASGEGTLYGYTYDSDTQEWDGGNLNVSWLPPYQECHDSPYAYGQGVATYFGAPFTQLACSGATFADGITTPELDDNGVQMSPAQFGNWTNHTDINAAYDAANPDLVLITLGADDLQFSPIVKACIENGYEYYFDLAKLECTAKNPGDTIQTDFFDFLPTLKQNYGTLVGWIEARAKANGRPAPKIVITNYANPIPPNGAKCPDTSWLYPAQTRYLSSLVGQANTAIASAINGLDDPNVVLADISQAYTPQGVSHIWCSDDPWAYGLSIISVTDPSSFDSKAPFHPTPDGQASISAHVIAAARTFFPPTTTTTTLAKAATTTTGKGTTSSTAAPSTTGDAPSAPSTTNASSTTSTTGG